MPALNLRLTHKANEAFRACLGDVLATTLDPFCKTRKVEVVYTISPDDVPLGSIAASLNNHTVSGRTGKSLDRVKKKVGDFMGEHAIEAVCDTLAPLAAVAVAEAPVDMSDVLDAVNAIPDTEDMQPDEAVENCVLPVDEDGKIDPADLAKAMGAEIVPTPEPKKKGLVSLVPKVRGADLLANLYRDIKKKGK